MDLQELFDRGQKAVEAETARLTAEREAWEAAETAKVTAYLLTITATLQAALPECVWNYIDITQVNAAYSVTFPENVFLRVPDCAPILMSIYLECNGESYKPGGMHERALTVPCVCCEMPRGMEEGGVMYSYSRNLGATDTKKLSYALALAKQRKQEFDAAETKYAAELVRQQKRHEAQQAARALREAEQAAEPTTEERLRTVLTDLVTEILDNALAARER